MESTTLSFVTKYYNQTSWIVVSKARIFDYIVEEPVRVSFIIFQHIAPPTILDM